MKFLMKVFFIMFVGATLIMGGCSQVNIGTRVLPNGQIQQILSVKMDTNAIKQAGLDVEDVMATAKSVIEEYMDNRYGTSTLVNRISTQSNNLTGEIFTGVFFANVNKYYEFYNVTSEELNEPNEIKKGLFYDTEYLSKNTLIFADESLNAEDGLYAEIESTFKSEFGDKNLFNKEKVSMSYSYAIPLAQAQVSRVRSNASSEYDYTDASGSTSYTLRYFVWEYDQNNKDFEMVLFVRHIHGWAWYMLAFVLTAIFAVILAIIKKFNDRKAKLMEIMNRMDNDEIVGENVEIDATRE